MREIFAWTLGIVILEVNRKGNAKTNRFQELASPNCEWRVQISKAGFNELSSSDIVEKKPSTIMAVIIKKNK